MKPGPNDVKLTILITGNELLELQRFTIDMVEAFGLDRRIEAYAGKRSPRQAANLAVSKVPNFPIGGILGSFGPG